MRVENIDMKRVVVYIGFAFYVWWLMGVVNVTIDFIKHTILFGTAILLVDELVLRYKVRANVNIDVVLSSYIMGSLISLLFIPCSA